MSNVLENKNPDTNDKPRLSIIGPISLLEPDKDISWQALARCSTSSARELLPYQAAIKLNVLPLAVHSIGSEKFLTIAAASLLGPDKLQELRFITGVDISVEVVAHLNLQSAIAAAYRGEKSFLIDSSLEANAKRQTDPISKTPSVNLEEHTAVADAELPRLLNRILERAVFLNASDIHLEPMEDGTRLRLRVDGVLQAEHGFKLTASAARGLSRRIKVISQLDSTITRLPQEGGFSFRSAAWDLRIRVSVVPQVNGEKIVLRLLHNSMLDSLADLPKGAFRSLGLAPEQERMIRSFLASDRGVMLLSGPTGSGKSTLLYSALLQLNSEDRNIVTLEDPVERLIPGVNQSEIMPKVNLGYVELLPKLLRQDPDVIMIGEIRDSVTAQTALEAGITGALVLSSVHAGNCLEVFSRLIQLKVEPPLISASLKLIVSQRLLPKNCSSCSSCQPADSLLQKLFMLPGPIILADSNGCSHCNGSGISGRLGVFELLTINEEIRQLIQSSLKKGQAWTPSLLRVAHSYGYQPYLFQVRRALIQQIISPRTALRAAGLDPQIILGAEC